MNQREIKFRAWDKKSKKMRNNFQVFIRDRELCYYSIWNPEHNSLILMQFTGLKDKNKKEIYEGDILKDDNDDLFEVKFGELPLDKSGDCVCTYPAFYTKGYGKLGSAPYHECNQIGNWMEVIGNIYENSNLLNDH